MPSNVHAHTALAATLAAGALAGVALRLAPPQTSTFYPLCPIHHFTGLLCPGCGTTRALAALAHGNLAEALHLNPLAIVALFCATVLALVAYARALQGQQKPWPLIPPPAIAVALAVTTIFTVVRNLL